MNNSFSKKAAVLFGWEKFKENIFLLLGVFLIIGVVSFIFEATDKLELSAFALFIIGLAGFVVQTVLEMGATRIVLNIHAGREAGFGDLVGETSQLLNFILAEILALIAVVVGMVLLVVPGIIVAVGFFFVPYIIIDKKLGPIEALKDSWRLTKGHKLNLFFFGLLLVLLNVLGALAFAVGLLVTLPISFLATVYAYKWLDTHDAPVVQKENE